MKLSTGFRIAVAVLLIGFTLLPSAYGAGRCDELWSAALDDNTGSIRQIVSSGTAVNCRDPQTAETPLMAAAMNGKVESVKLLLSLGADPNLKNAHGTTALDMARDREKAFTAVPSMAAVRGKLREVITALESRTTATSRDRPPLVVSDADPNMVARLKLQSARSAVMAGKYSMAMNNVNEILGLRGLSDANRASALALSGQVGFTTHAWAQVKRDCEKVLAISAADRDDQDSCKDYLKALRQYHPELFR